jgi:hypothetical protein
MNLQIGQETVIRVVNNTASTITNGSVVYLTGASGVFPTVALAKADAIDTYYVAGNSLTYTLKELTTALEVGYYQYAPILSDLAEHWMLDVMPWTIIDLASARIFKTIGDDNSFRAYLSTGTESYKMFRNDLEDSILAAAR